MKLDVEGARSAIIAGLPAQARWWLDDEPLDFDFTQAARGFRTITSEDVVGGGLEKSWSGLLLFGRCDYTEGGGASPWIALRIADRAVCGLDVEREAESIFTFNSAVDRFIRTFALLHEYLSRGRPLPPDIGSRAEEIDPACYRRSDWRSLIDSLAAA